RMPDHSGFEVLSFAQGVDQDLPVILLTAHSDVPTAMKAMKAGAYDYLEKPCSTERLIDALTRALDHRELALRSRRIERELLRNDAAAVNFPGSSPVSEALRNALRGAAQTSAQIHLTGPAGAGKKQAAYAISQLSDGGRPLKRINLAHATAEEVEALNTASECDISVKNLDAATLPQQSALVAIKANRADLRLITSSVHSLEELRTAGIAEELCAAADILEVRIPSLADRRQDLAEIFEFLLRQASRSVNADMPDVSEALLADVLTRPWEGNLPEMRAFAASVVLGARTQASAGPTLTDQMDAFERLVLTETLKRCDGRAADAAAALGLPRNTFYDRLARHGLTPKDFR
ncbi:MAG: response regulator, partial [Pseudomonadota bacterium]